MSNDDQTIEEARAQAAEYLGMGASKRVRAGKESFEIPNPSLLTRDQQRKYNQLRLSLEELDRWPDVKNDDGDVISQGQPKVPHRKGGVLEDDYDEKLTKVLLGDEAAERFFENGGQPSDISLLWTEMQKRLMDRGENDSKSGRSSAALAVVPDSD